MTILHLVSSLDPAGGGVSQALRTIIEGLSKLKVRNEVVCLDRPNAGYLVKENFKVYALGPGRTSWQYSPTLLKWLTENLHGYDAVIVHGLWHYQTYATYRAWKSLTGKKPKLFVMPHGMLDPYFIKAKGRKLKAIRNQIFWKLNERNIVNNSCGLLFTCEVEKLLAREPFIPYHPIREEIVGLGVEDPPLYLPEMTKAFEQRLGQHLEKYLLFISRIHEKKGVDLLIEAYIELRFRGIRIPDLVIAGPGLETSYGKHMQELAAGTKGVFFPGMLTGDAKWGAFYGCEAFVLPSHQENFGIAIVEAMACSKPVLISDKVNIWSEIQKAGAGIITSDTLEGTLKSLQRWSSISKAEKLEISQRARKSYEERFAIAPSSERLLKTIKQ